MCVIWNQDQWREAAKDTSSHYHVIGEYTNANGETALTILHDAIPGKVFHEIPTVRNVYSRDGYDEQILRYGDYNDETGEWPERPVDEQLRLAEQEMAAHGFTNEVVRVQGRTIAEWQREGELNEGRKPSEHVHPVPPVDRVPTHEELEALAASSTVAEAMFILDQMLMGVGASA